MPSTFSSTWPPSSGGPLGVILQGLFAAGPLQTTWPPRSRTQNQLTGLASDEVSARLLRMEFDANAGGPFSTRIRGAASALPQVLVDEADALVKQSRAALGHLIGADFWQRTALAVDAPAPWVQGAPVPGFAVTIDDPAGRLLAYTQAPQSHADLVAAVGVTAVSPARLKDILIQAPTPELCLLRKFQDIRDANFASATPPFPWTCWVVDATIDVLASVAHRLKHAIRLPRPLDTGMGYTGRPQATPLLGLDLAYTAYPGGHASLMAALVVVLSKITRCDAQEAPQLEAYAKVISANREAAGLHTRLDTDAGWRLGLALGQVLVDAAKRQHLANGSPVYTYLSWAAAFQSAQGEWA